MILIGAPPCELRVDESVTLSGDSIRVADALICTDELSPDTGELAIASLPANSREIHLSREAVADLVRRRVPGLADLKASDGLGTMTFRRGGAPAPGMEASAHCFAAARRFASGEAIASEGVSETACRADREKVRLAYDREQRVVRATVQVEAGDYLGRLMPLSSSNWDQGQTLTLRVQVGPVTIDRVVQAMEPATAGGQIFVKGVDGAVFQAPVAALAIREKPND